MDNIPQAKPGTQKQDGRHGETRLCNKGMMQGGTYVCGEVWVLKRLVDSEPLLRIKRLHEGEESATATTALADGTQGE